IPQVVQVLAKVGHLPADPPQQGEQGLALLLVIDTVVSRHARVEPLRVIFGVILAHVSTKPPSCQLTAKRPFAGSWGSFLRMASSAGRMKISSRTVSGAGS